VLPLAATSSASVSQAIVALTPLDLRTGYAVDPVGIDTRNPRLSWRLESSERGARQAAYRIQVALSPEALSVGGDLFWDTGRVPSGQSVHVRYDGPPLTSGTRYHWRVRVWDPSGVSSKWSPQAFWEMGLLDSADWHAQWIRPDLVEDTTTSNPSPMLRATFRVDGRVATARLYVTSLGLHQVTLNGAQVSDRLFTPGWTSYETRLQYETHDVGGQLRAGENVLGVILGDGWYRGRLGWSDQRNTYGAHLGLLAQLVIRYTDGRTQVVGSDSAWRAATGPILGSDIYDGEVYDARLQRTGWDRPGYDDAGWAGVRVFEHPKSILIAPVGPPVRRVQEVKPVSIFRTPAGETVADMGQNMVGWIRLRVRGPPGATVTLRHAEVLDSAGNVYTANLRTAKAAVRYTLAGTGDELYEPHFTFMGFRYVAVEGYPGELTTDALTGIVVHSDMPRTGTFETSDPMLNRLQSNILWGQKGNFVDVPTDTPARDERMGWTGDAQAFVGTAAFNFEVAPFFTKWLVDLAADQRSSGSVPFVVPDVIGGAGSAGWGDAATIVPWALYLAYGDTLVLERQYESMRSWVDFIRGRAGEDLIWSEDFTFGDWLAFNTTSSDYPGATTDKDLIATAFFAHSTDLVARTADVLGRTADARTYRSLFQRIGEAFDREYVTETGRIASNTQTAYALALAFELLPESMRDEAGRRLAEDVQRFGHLTTGFLGTPHLLHALHRTGHTAVAYELLLREEYPSWLYPITKGATTMWERWDGIRPDGTFQDVGMNSFNHYAYGAVGDWMYRVVAGIDVDPEEPGYRHVRIRPRPGGGLTFARASLNTVYGDASSAWQLDSGTFRLTVHVPPNTHATVRLPDAGLGTVEEGGVPLSEAVGVTSAAQDGDDVVVETGSGEYRFVYPRIGTR
jgi:alpha-L-rhamnosidase